MSLDGHVHQLLVFPEQFTISIGRFRGMGHDGDDGREFPRAHLPDVEIADVRIAVAFHRAANLVRQIRRRRRAVEKNSAGILHETVGPDGDDCASHDSHHRIEPEPAEIFPGNQRDDGGHRGKRIGEDMDVGRAEV